MTLLPLDIKVEGQTCLMVGGGEVAFRKVQALLEAGAKIRLVSPEISEELQKLVQKEKVDWQKRAFQESDIHGCLLAVAATDDREVNRRVSQAGALHRVLVNVVDDPELSQCYFPSYFRRSRLLITVSSTGASPALSAALRREIEAGFSKETAAAIDVLAEFRERVQREIESPGIKMNFWKRFFKPGVLALIREGKAEQLKKELESAYSSYRA